MSDRSLRPCSTLIAGKTGTGKTTFAIRRLGNCPEACLVSAFDDLEDVSDATSWPLASDAHTMEAQLPTGRVLFNPHRMFVPDGSRTDNPMERAYRFYCDWIFQVSKSAPGIKLVFVDEVWRFQSPYGILPEHATWANAGRSQGIWPMYATTLPHKVHSAITGACTELVCFRLDEPLALAKMQEIGFPNPDRLRGLLPGQFIALNRMSGRELRWDMFENRTF